MPKALPRTFRAPTPLHATSTAQVVRLRSRNELDLSQGLDRFIKGAEAGHITGLGYALLMADGSVRFGTLGDARTDHARTHLAASRLAAMALFPEDFEEVRP